jgi:hypothetical protein
MSHVPRFSLAGASAAADGGDEEIARWVGDFLAVQGGNPVLAAALARAPHWWFGPVELPLVSLERLAGPEDGAPCPVSPAQWAQDVGAMEESLDDGWEPPPLLAEWQHGRLLLQDGNHRFEALVRAGASHAWTLVYFPSLDDRDRFAAHYLEELRINGRRP